MARTSLWPQVTVKAIQIGLVPGGSMAHRHQHGFRHRPWASTYSWVVTKAKDIYQAPDSIRTTDPHVAISGITDHGGSSKKANCRNS